jgi:alpha-L-fucosidase
LLTNYGPVDILFIDGPVVGRQDEGLKDFCWAIQPDLVITRGAMDTPEQELPGKPLKGPWEACFTLGRAWQYQPTNEDYKSGTQLIHMLVETRAKGGNLLLNIAPQPDGSLRPEEEQRVREMALWNFANGEAVLGSRAWHVTNEGRVWFTSAKRAGGDEGDEDGDDATATVYAVVTGDPVTGEVWQYGTRKSVMLKSVRATDKTEVSVLGQSGERVEYRPFIDAKTTWTQDDAGLYVSAVNCQRLADDRKWPNPVVLKITHAKAAGGGAR